jgi:hypothetical protein
MLTAHDILRFRRRQVSMRIYNLSPWHRGSGSGWAWMLELEDDDDDGFFRAAARASSSVVAVRRAWWRSRKVSGGPSSYRTALLSSRR